MDETTPEHLRETAPDLASAIRRARIEGVERSDAFAEMRGAEIARLEMLHDAIRPILAQVPEEIDYFDVAVARGDRPRLFIDMIGFVEMGSDRRTYRFHQDTRHGRVTMAESDRLDTMTEAVTAYIARRLVERERALAGDTTIADAALRHPADAAARLTGGPPSGARARFDAARLLAVDRDDRPARRFGRLLLVVLLHALEYLGVVALLIVLIAGGFVGYQLLHAWLAAWLGAPLG